MKVLLFTPPMTQINTPYPASTYLTGFLRSQNIDAEQCDPGIELVCALFSKKGLRQIKAELLKTKLKDNPPSIQFFLEAYEDYEKTVEDVVEFLQGKNPALAFRLARRIFAPEGPRFQSLFEHPELLVQNFGSLGVQDQAKHIASLYIDDLTDVVSQGICEDFKLSKYGEKLAASQSDFSVIEKALNKPFNLIEHFLEEILTLHLKKSKPDLVGLSVPFPGNFLGALRSAQIIKKHLPQCKIAMGGGYPNTELRNIKDNRLFDYIDFMTMDDGEKPLLNLIQYLKGTLKKEKLYRTFLKDEHENVVFISCPENHDIPQSQTSLPTTSGLPMNQYMSMLEMLNPMHRLWSDLRWNKLTLAHGCYWKKCNFCDTTLDYIGRYETSPVELTLQRMRSLIKETNVKGFHFVDEAAPPAILKSLSEHLIKENLQVTWWGNVRFEKTFTQKLTDLMADAGCVAISGGLEVASDRLLKLMNKGVTVEQVAKVTHAFQSSGILVHAYLMYGFPTQTTLETIDALERVRQLFKEGCIQSAYWHRFSATTHSPIGKNPKSFKIEINQRPSTFANNDLHFHDSTKTPHDELGVGLNKALFNYMHGVALDEDVRSWFNPKLNPPKTTVSKRLIKECLRHSL